MLVLQLVEDALMLYGFNVTKVDRLIVYFDGLRRVAFTKRGIKDRLVILEQEHLRTMEDTLNEDKQNGTVRYILLFCFFFCFEHAFVSDHT